MKSQGKARPGFICQLQIPLCCGAVQLQPHSVIVDHKSLRLEKANGGLIKRPHAQRQRFDSLAAGVGLGGVDQRPANTLSLKARFHADVVYPKPL